MLEEILLHYGPVVVTAGPFAGRIGHYDCEEIVFDDDDSLDRVLYPPSLAWVTEDLGEPPQSQRILHVGVVYFGDLFVAPGYYLIPLEYLRPVTIGDLRKRLSAIENKQGIFTTPDEEDFSPDDKLELMCERHYIEFVLTERSMIDKYVKPSSECSVFMSHSSSDKDFARDLVGDLQAAGHALWFDDSSIIVGDSIPGRIAEGLGECDFVVVVLSKDAVNSRWVEKEWHAKYWDEVNDNKVIVLPVLYEDCEIPQLLKTKRYADFRRDYNRGLKELLSAIDNLSGG